MPFVNKDGRAIEGEPIGLTSTSVKVKRKDGQIFDIPLSNLSEDTCSLLETRRKQLLADIEQKQQHAKAAEIAKEFAKVAVTNTIVKKVGGKYRYFFDIRNHSDLPFTGSVRITLLNKMAGVSNGGNTFDATKPIQPGLGTFVFLDAYTGPESVHADASIARFNYEILDANNVVSQSSGSITTTLEILE
jgi:hypothetical protein